MVDAGDLEQVSVRLETFVGWPRPSLPPQILSSAGFFYISLLDRVCCAFCGIVLGDWELRGEPMVEHARYSPSCRFVRNYSGSYIPVQHYTAFRTRFQGGEEEDGGQSLTTRECEKMKPVYFEFANNTNRLNTFKKWPIALKTRPGALCEAGLFYTGLGDYTICFHCGVGLCDWEDDDDPWIEHAIYAPNCNYVLSIKGFAFVSSLKRSSTTTVNSEHADTKELSKSNTGGKESDISETESGLCKVCYLNEASIVFLPCAHLVSCGTCATKLSGCPVCRCNIKATVRVFLV